MMHQFLPPTDEELDQFRQAQAVVRVVRDAYEANDVIGKIMGWDDEVVLIRRPRGTVLKMKRKYPIQDASEPRLNLFSEDG